MNASAHAPVRASSTQLFHIDDKNECATSKQHFRQLNVRKQKTSPLFTIDERFIFSMKVYLQTAIFVVLFFFLVGRSFGPSGSEIQLLDDDYIVEVRAQCAEKQFYNDVDSFLFCILQFIYS